MIGQHRVTDMTERSGWRGPRRGREELPVAAMVQIMPAGLAPPPAAAIAICITVACPVLRPGSTSETPPAAANRSVPSGHAVWRGARRHHPGRPLARETSVIEAGRRKPYSQALRRHGRGEMADAGLEAVFLGNRPALARFLRARDRTSDVDDLLQELWLKLAAAPPSGPIAEPIAYLYRMADNLIHDRRRANARRERRDAAWSAAATTVPDVSDEPSAERVLLARERLRRIEQALAALGERSAAIFRRFRVDGVSQKLIAAEQGISLSAVEKHLQRAYRAVMAVQAGEADADAPVPRRRGDENPIDVAR